MGWIYNSVIAHVQREVSDFEHGGGLDGYNFRSVEV